MAETLKTLFDRLGKDLTIDAHLMKRIHQYERAFANKNSDHVEFLGGNLMGVHPFRFTPVDRENWFGAVVYLDELEIRDEIAKLPTINMEWKRASDAMNLSCIWLLHAIQRSTLPMTDKKEGMVATLLILQYKFLASMMAHWFPYVADRQTMEAAYASLSRRYSLKVAGSWNRLLKQRAEEVISTSGIHRKTIQSFEPDHAIIEMINDIQGRMRKIIRALSDVFYTVRAAGGRIGINQTVLEANGEKFVKPLMRDYTSYTRYLKTVMGDVNSLIRKELVDVVCDLQHTLPAKALEESLDWMSLNHLVEEPRWKPVIKGSYVETFIDEVLLHAFSVMQSNPGVLTKRSGLAPLLQQLRGLYMASRMSDPALLKTRDMADQIVKSAISSRNPSIAASARTGIMLYLVARALTRDYFS